MPVVNELDKNIYFCVVNKLEILLSSDVFCFFGFTCFVIDDVLFCFSKIHPILGNFSSPFAM